VTWPEFKRKWSQYSGKESAAYQEHFNDICHLLGQPTPAQADPTGEEFFCFQKRVVKDLELFATDLPADAEPGRRGFADVWKKDCFGWEYKGKKKDLAEAYKQLQRYREALLNPPLLVVCDFDRYIIRTNFNGTVQETHEFTNDQIDRPENLRLLGALFTDPEYLKPQKTTAQVTEKLAERIAEIARLLQERESVELTDAKTRKQVHVAQKKNLRIARFLNRIVFCLFAEDTGLLPPAIFSEITKTGLDDPRFFAERLEELFRVMARGGSFGTHKIRRFNGHLFEEATVFELSPDEIRQLADASEADWRFIEPSIMGTLFERALDDSHRAQLGAHYTSEEDIKTLVEPVLMQPFRREWAKIKGALAAAFVRQKGTSGERSQLAAFQKKLSSVTVLDPACGSGNFLYVSLQLLLALEKEVITFATQLGLSLKPQVSVKQLKAIEINPYAYELAQVSVQIGYLQWRRDNGFDNDRTPVLQNLDGFENKDALLHETFRKRPKNLKQARKEEHGGQDELFKVYLERAWPECDVIVGNPPFLGNYLLRRELSDAYVDGLFECFDRRVRRGSDLCCYWFEKARELIEQRKCHRAGLLATQGIRGGANREVLVRIKQTGNIFFAVSDREWILGGANVHVSMVAFDVGAEKDVFLDGVKVPDINPDLTSHANVTTARQLTSSGRICFMGPSPKAPFDLPEHEALSMIRDSANAHTVPNSDVLRPVHSAVDLVQRFRRQWTLDFGSMSLETATRYEAPFKWAQENIFPIRSKNTRQTNLKWWQYERPRIEMRDAISELRRLLTTPGVSKHRLYVWRSPEVLCNQGTLVYARSDDYFLGIIHSRYHEIWALAQGTQLREEESGFRYTPTTCFETFPFPFRDDLSGPLDNLEAELNAAKHYAHIVLREDPAPATPAGHRDAVAAAAEELNELRERWLNPPEWTVTKILEFPGSVGGPWSRYINSATVDSETTNLYNERPAWLDLAHKKLDAAVASAYGWPADLSDDQILEQLLKLNLERAALEEPVQPKRKAQREKHESELV
jgi:hypothetical protein